MTLKSSWEFFPHNPVFFPTAFLRQTREIGPGLEANGRRSPGRLVNLMVCLARNVFLLLHWENGVRVLAIVTTAPSAACQLLQP